MQPHASSALTFWVMLSVLAIVVTFGAGTTVNMLFKRWWLSLALYLAFTVYLLLTAAMKMNAGEWTLFVVGLVGAVLSAWGVRALKQRGYGLFQ